MKVFDRLIQRSNMNQEDKSQQQGFTLVELIAALSLLSVVLGVIYTTITFGMNAYNKVRIENTLRDEGDIIMSLLITKLYTFGADGIFVPAEQRELGSGIMLSNHATNIPASITLGIPQDGSKHALLIDGTAVEVVSEVVPQAVAGDGGSTITLSNCPTQGICSSGLINIHLKLTQTYAGKDYTIALDSKFGF